MISHQVIKNDPRTIDLLVGIISPVFILWCWLAITRNHLIDILLNLTTHWIFPPFWINRITRAKFPLSAYGIWCVCWDLHACGQSKDHRRTRWAKLSHSLLHYLVIFQWNPHWFLIKWMLFLILLVLSSYLFALYIKIGKHLDEQIWFSVFEGWNE